MGRWPATAGGERYQQLRTSAVETLVVNGALDVMTPPQLASRELLPYLPNGREVILPGFGHTNSFFRQQPDAGTHLVNRFFDTGAVDVSQYHRETVDFTPPSGHGTVARMLLATLVSSGALAMLSLVVLARRVRTRGRVGPVAAATLRSLYAVVLGLGGWSLGALIVLTALPAVRITDPLVVVPSVAVPIGLGIYFAWTHREWAASTRRAGGIAAGTAALAGAWLGFSAAPSPMALVTAIAGAVAAGNLALLVVDMRSSRPVGAPPAAATTADVPDAEPPIPATIGMP